MRMDAKLSEEIQAVIAALALPHALAAHVVLARILPFFCLRQVCYFIHQAAVRPDRRLPVAIAQPPYQPQNLWGFVLVSSVSISFLSCPS